VDSLRVRWVPLYCFPTLSLRPFAVYVAFLRSDYYGLFDCLEGLGAFGTGLPCLLPTLLHIPFRLSRVQHRRLNRDVVGGVLCVPLPLFVAPSSLHRVESGLPVFPRTHSYVLNECGPYSYTHPIVSGSMS
jgi:hypothetical protein